MVVFVMLSSALAMLAVAWFTRPLWWRPKATDAAALPRSMGCVALLGAFVAVFTAGGYAAVGTPRGLMPGPGYATEPGGAMSKGQVEAIIERALRVDPDSPRTVRLIGSITQARELAGLPPVAASAAASAATGISGE